MDVGVRFASKFLYGKNETTDYLLQLSVDEQFIKLNGKRKAFHKGGNSSCRLHIRQHYPLYKQRCEKDNIPVNHWAIPRSIWKAMEEEKEAGRMNKKLQQELEFKSVMGPQDFTRERVHAVAKLIATNDQVSISIFITKIINYTCLAACTR